MRHIITKGFTLIELLVVITIIGILATGAVTTFTSQIQKARDTTRISDIKAIQGGVEQFYQDGGSYPQKGTSFSGVTDYVQTLPSDPKSWQASANSVFDYTYNVSADANTIPEQQYELSTHFEQSGNISKKAATDNGDDPYRLEIGISLQDWSNTTAVDLDTGLPSSINSMTCVTSAGAADGWCADSSPMVIRK